jgi:hypothetical protein
MRAILSRFIVSRSVFDPILAAARAASHPACPAPITITSYISFIPDTAIILPLSTTAVDVILARGYEKNPAIVVSYIEGNIKYKKDKSDKRRFHLRV